MWFFRRRRPEAATQLPGPSFGEWALRSFASDEPVPGMTFARLEQVCSNAASLLCGAAYAEPEAARDAAPSDATLAEEASLMARRTADGFKAALADRDNAVLAWPWDHLATRLAWQATRNEATLERDLGDGLWQISALYALRHREQLQHVLSLWDQVASGVLTGAQSRRPSLERMGREALAAYRSGVVSLSAGHP
ncbi:MAG: hypothetical protein M0R74_01775 [Dehalococcoidia bacterium]|nr:hypothetical protein [Dehalococcoidia bacterium]